MELDFSFMRQALPFLLKALPMTLFLTALVLLLSIVPAFLMAEKRIGAVGIGEKGVALYVSFIRGTPLVLQILLMYTLLPSMIQSLVKAMGMDFDVFHGINPLWYAVIVFTLNTTALFSEVFRSALLSVSEGQMEAGLTIGLSRFQTNVQIIIPQALTSALPNICNLTVNLIKGTSLAFFMGIRDIMVAAKIQASYGYNYIEAYLEVFILYVIVCTAVQVLYKIFEKRAGLYRTAGQEG